MTGADIIAVVILIALAIAIIVYLLHWLYRRSSKDVSFVRTGMGGEKVVLTGGAMVLPIVHNVTMVGMRTLCIEIRRSGEKSLITRNRMRVELVAEFYVRVKPNKESVSIAAQALGKRTMEPDSLRELVQGRFIDALAIVAATMSMDEMQEKRGEYIKQVKGLAEDHLSRTGLELETVSLTGLDQAPLEMFNPSNAFDAEGLTQLTQQIEARKKARNDIEQETFIQIRDKNLETEKLALEIDKESELARLRQEQEISEKRTLQRSAIMIDRAERERDAEEVQIRAQEAIEVFRISQKQVIDVERKLTETRLVAEIEKRKREQNEIERNTAVEIEEKNLEAEMAILELHKGIEFARIGQQREIAVRVAKERAVVSLEEAENMQIARIAELAAHERVREADLTEQKNLDLVRIATEQETRLSDIARSKAIQMEEYDRDLVLIAKSKMVYEAKVQEEEAHALAIKAEEEVSTSREASVADRKKIVDLILADASAQVNAIKLTTLAAAETEVAHQRNLADEYASLAAKIRYEIDAAGAQKLNESENMRSESSRTSELRMQLARNLDAIIRESVRPMESIDSIKIIEVNGLPGFSQGAQSGGDGEQVNRGSGGGNLAENVVNSALRYRAQMPFVDNLLEEIGMSASEIGNVRNILGDARKAGVLTDEK